MPGHQQALQAIMQLALAAVREAVAALVTLRLLALVEMAALLAVVVAVAQVGFSACATGRQAALAHAVKSGSLSSRTDNSWPQ
jgi:hypothetical protein